MVSYLTSFDSNIVSIIMFEIFDEKVLLPRSRDVVQGHAIKVKDDGAIVPIDLIGDLYDSSSSTELCCE